MNSIIKPIMYIYGALLRILDIKITLPINIEPIDNICRNNPMRLGVKGK